VEAVEFRQGWSVAARRGREKTRKTKEGGLSPEEGDVKEEEDQGRREGGSAKARFRVSLTKNFIFGSRVFGF
jgi:hypothetical protein